MVMTAIIDLTNQNSDSAVSYADDAEGLLPHSKEWIDFFNKLLEPLPDKTGFRFKGGFLMDKTETSMKISLTDELDDDRFDYCEEDIKCGNYLSLMFTQMFSILINKSLNNNVCPDVFNFDK